RSELTALQYRLDPVALLQEIRHRQRRLVEKGQRDEGECQPLDKFLAAMKTAWKDGTPRPTEQRPPANVRWWRWRKDPFEKTWPEIREWAESATAAGTISGRLPRRAAPHSAATVKNAARRTGAPADLCNVERSHDPTIGFGRRWKLCPEIS